MKKSLVLLSAGLDSTVNAFAAAAQGHLRMALTFDYGQRAAANELAAAARIASHLNVQHKILSLPWFKEFNRSSLLVSELDIPMGQGVSLEDPEQSRQSAQSVWVPNRNGVFLNIGAAFAEALDMDTLIPGFNKEEAATFPDNSAEFLAKTNEALWYATANHVKVECATVALNKTEIVKKGLELGVPWDMIWPCYFSGAQWCGQCESCQRSRRAFTAAGIDLRHLYKE